MSPEDLAKIRRENTRRAVAANGGPAAVARKMNHTNPAFLSQMLGPKPTRNVTEATARELERVLELEAGALDRDPSAPAPARAEIPMASTELIASVVRLVGQACESEQVPLGSAKFADLVALAYADSLDHGGVARPDHVKALVRLAK